MSSFRLQRNDLMPQSDGDDAEVVSLLVGGGVLFQAVSDKLKDLISSSKSLNEYEHNVSNVEFIPFEEASSAFSEQTQFCIQLQ